ncbi:alpha/beta hydrolase [Pseudoalteromonas sp. T1lg88]|uniref:alpha/beta hydrolase n=1 Tax=Pseudoalteromonas sp. T1lg88 TaxID=2077104 RepID=UPI000CF6C18B|nr:alpha/beta fold hydrolase [Pseudoalteromonas sp. T1lg88]
MRLLLCFLLGLTSSFSWAQTCLSHIDDIDYIMAAKKNGSHRFAQDASVQALDLDSLPPFSAYLASARDWIDARNPRASLPCPVHTETVKLLQAQGALEADLTVSDLLSPFELRHPGSNKAVLLLHGLTDSPFSYHSLAAFFHRQGFNVRTVLLPGHGSAASDLQEVSFKQWQALTRYAIERTSKDFEQVIIGGYSTGAALALANLIERPVPQQVQALMLWSPATEPHNKQGWLAKWIDRIPFVNWIDKDADIDFAKYESFPFAAASLGHEAMRRIDAKHLAKAKLPDLPLFVVQSEVDTTIDSQATLALVKAWHNPQMRPNSAKDMLIYYGNPQTAKRYLGKDFPLRSYACQANQPPCNKIIDLSHISVVNAPNHPYYGAQGHYRNCGSYLEDDTAYRRCKTQAQVLIGERSEENLAKGPLKRLTYNPFYAELEQDMRTFLGHLHE